MTTMLHISQQVTSTLQKFSLKEQILILVIDQSAPIPSLFTRKISVSWSQTSSSSSQIEPNFSNYQEKSTKTKRNCCKYLFSMNLFTKLTCGPSNVYQKPHSKAAQAVRKDTQGALCISHSSILGNVSTLSELQISPPNTKVNPHLPQRINMRLKDKVSASL